MLTQLEAEIATNGVVRLLAPLKIPPNSRAIVPIIHSRPSEKTEGNSGSSRKNIRDLFGSASLGRPTGADNEEIDSDLANEYSNAHEE